MRERGEQQSNHVLVLEIQIQVFAHERFVQVWPVGWIHINIRMRIATKIRREQIGLGFVFRFLFFSFFVVGRVAHFSGSGGAGGYFRLLPFYVEGRGGVGVAVLESNV